MKGVLFTLLLVLITLSLASLILLEKELSFYRGEMLGIKIRVESMKRFYDNIVKDSSQALQIISRRAISAAVSYVVSSGEGLDEANETLKELILNGTILNTSEPLMEDATFEDWMGKIENIGEENGFYTNLECKKLEIKPFDSWNLLAEAVLEIKLVDMRGIANLSRNVTIREFVPIDSFEDPIYPLNTQGRVTNIITRTPYFGNFTKLLLQASGGNNHSSGLSIVVTKNSIPYVENVSDKILVTDEISGMESYVNQFAGLVCECDVGSIDIPFVENATNAMQKISNNTFILVDGNEGKVWSLHNFKLHVENSFYTQSLKGASFLDRLEGKLEVQEKYAMLSDNLIGLESFVNKELIAMNGIPIDIEKTSIDHLYFSEESHPGRKIKGMEDYLRIDEELCTFNLSHAEIYQVDEILE